jgi:hypothetical protein
MAAADRCQRCGRELEVLRHPVRRLSWTRHWWTGVSSYFTGQLWICPGCGAMYTGAGELVAAGAVETEAERRFNAYRKDMAYIRDGFAGVVIAAELAVIWLAGGAETFELAKVLLAGGVGVVALGPFAYFAHRAREAKRELRRLRRAREGGALLGGRRPVEREPQKEEGRTQNAERS